VYWVDCAPGMHRRFLACEARIAVTYKRSGWRRLILDTESSELAGVEEYIPYKPHTATHIAAESGWVPGWVPLACGVAGLGVGAMARS
jgi:hypothetical protein